MSLDSVLSTPSLATPSPTNAIRPATAPTIYEVAQHTSLVSKDLERLTKAYVQVVEEMLLHQHARGVVCTAKDATLIVQMHLMNGLLPMRANVVIRDLLLPLPNTWSEQPKAYYLEADIIGLDRSPENSPYTSQPEVLLSSRQDEKQVHYSIPNASRHQPYRGHLPLIISAKDGERVQYSIPITPLERIWYDNSCLDVAGLKTRTLDLMIRYPLGTPEPSGWQSVTFREAPGIVWQDLKEWWQKKRGLASQKKGFPIRTYLCPAGDGTPRA